MRCISPASWKNEGMWNANRAVDYLNTHATGHSLGRCAEFTRKAVEAGGVTLARHQSAKDYGRSLFLVGFQPIELKNEKGEQAPLKAGDVAIIQPIPGHPHGHMTMYNGKIWISDFRQRTMYPGQSYRKHHPPFTVYRYAYACAAQ